MLAILNGCSAFKKSAGTTSYTTNEKIDGNIIESVIENNLSNDNFYIQKADINVIQNNVSVRFTASIKFRKPDTLLITVRSKAGIEAGRALITKDTIIINDRINKKLLVGSPAVIGPKYGIEPSLIFVVIGDVIVDEKDSKRSLNCLKGTYSDEFEINGKKVDYIIDCDKRKAIQAYFEGDIKSGNITINFSDIMSSGQVKFARTIKINDDLNSLDIHLEIKKIERPWNGRIGFVPGAGFKVIKIK